MGRKKSVKDKLIQFLVYTPILSFITWKIFHLIYETNPTPYMDEIFHIPQAQLYCANVWDKWNPKITTLPGLYLVSYLILKPLEILKANVCSVYALRFVNMLGTIMNFLLTFLILSKLHNVSTVKNTSHLTINIMSAFNLAMFPPLYFFTFLYYTDVWSLTFVLLMYYGYTCSNSKFLIAFAGLMAVLMRQTNIIWVGYIIMNIIWDILVKSKELKQFKFYNFHKINKKAIQKYVNIMKSSKERWKSLAKEMIATTYPSLLVCAGFIVFLLWNGGVVVGDKKAHTAVIHPMQNLYFLDFAAFFGFPYFFVHLWSRRKLPSFTVLLALTFVFAVLSEVNKLEHPYLLADNRHIAFYIWRRLFGHNIMRRVLVPTYTAAAVILWDMLSHRTLMFKILLGFCIFFNLTFQHLFELRYFIIPFVLCRLHFRQSNCVLFEFIFFSVINAFTIYLFTKRSFTWSSEPNAVQRFIW